MKICSKCKTEKDESAFSQYRRNSDGLCSWCKRCNADAQLERYRALPPEQRRVRKRNPETLRVQRNRAYQRNKVEILLRQGAREYGITPQEYARLRAQPCGICGVYKSEPGKRGSGMHIDHDHVTGKIRGTLCDRCNRGIGMFDDDPFKLAAAIAYLQR